MPQDLIATCIIRAQIRVCVIASYKRVVPWAWLVIYGTHLWLLFTIEHKGIECSIETLHIYIHVYRSV